MIDQPTIDRILDTANIVDVVSEFVTLKRRGVNYVGLCPFHEDKSPSFYVSPAKNICKCFACGEGGTAVHFIMKHEQMSYYDALRYLAKKYNIEIQEHELTEEQKQVHNDRESMLIVNTWAQEYFTSLLHESEEGRIVGLRYFAERGFRDDTIRKFQLGYSLDKWDDLYQTAVKNGYKQEYLEKTGLVIAHENGKVSDRFRGRVIFPVHTLSGKVIAFGGRVLKKDDKTAKYVNSPESELYHKSNELYGIFFAKQSIVKSDKCFLVEGYTDVISMHQAGIENVVASSGTALTHGQIRLIHRFTNNITVLYDGDAAGIKAALRGIDLLLKEGMNIKVVLLPDGEDPDSFARTHSSSQYLDFISKNETDFIRFKTKLLLNEAGNDPIKRATLISDIVRSVAIIPDDIARTVYIRECSALLEIREEVLLNEVNKIRLKEKEEQWTEKKRNDARPPQGSPADEFAAPTEEEATAQPSSPGGEAAAASLSPETVVPVASSLPLKFKPYEDTLLRYVVRYGERILFDYVDEESGQPVRMRVAEYIRFDLQRDDIEIFNPVYRQMLDEAVEHGKKEGFVASRYFLAHTDPQISRIAANMLGEKYHLSKYHTRYQELEQEEDKLEHMVVADIYALKFSYIMYQRQEVSQQIKEASEANDLVRAFELMKQQQHFDKIKSILSKELGERIILKR